MRVFGKRKNTADKPPRTPLWDNPIPTTKITGDDVQQAITRVTKGRLIAGSLILCLIASFGIISIAYHQLNTMAQEIDRVHAQTTTVSQEVYRLSASQPAGQKATSNVVRSATTAGRAVAELQTQYAQLTDAEAIHDHAVKLDKYLADDSRNSRTPWYQHPGVTWTFKTTVSFTGTTAQALWLAQDEQGHVYAYTTGVYDATTGMFNHVHTANTAQGNANVAGTIEHPDKRKLDDLMDTIRKSTSGDKPAPFDAQAQAQLNAGREHLRDAQTGGQR